MNFKAINYVTVIKRASLLVVAIIRLSCFLKRRAVLIAYKDIRRYLNVKAEIPYIYMEFFFTMKFNG